MQLLKVIERRGRPRIEGRFRIEIEGYEEEVETYTGDISKSGMFVAMNDVPFKKGEQVKLRIELQPSLETILIQGKVSRLQGPNRLNQPEGMAVEFIKIEAKKAKHFDHFLDLIIESRGLGCRKHPRATMQMVVEYRSKDELKKATADNIAVGGAFLQTSPDEFVLGDRISLILLHPTSRRKFVIESEVVHLRKGESEVDQGFKEGIGLSFMHPSQARREDMVRFLKSMLSAQKRKA